MLIEAERAPPRRREARLPPSRPPSPLWSTKRHAQPAVLPEPEPKRAVIRSPLCDPPHKMALLPLPAAASRRPARPTKTPRFLPQIDKFCHSLTFSGALFAILRPEENRPQASTLSDSRESSALRHSCAVEASSTNLALLLLHTKRRGFPAVTASPGASSSSRPSQCEHHRFGEQT